MPSIPKDPLPESSIAFLRDPYRFIGKRCATYGSDIFQTRLLLQPTICIQGAEAAKIFYDEKRFCRSEAAPLPLQRTLFGSGGVQTLDDEAHRLRKQMFMSLMTSRQIGQLSELFARMLRSAAKRWETEAQVPLYEEMQRMLTQAVCTWAGVPVGAEMLDTRVRQLTLLFEGAGSFSLAHWRAWRARVQSEKWLAELVRAIRKQRYAPGDTTAAHTIAWQQDHRHTLLEPRVAAVELLNVLRPTVAVAVYIVWIVHALEVFAHVRERLLEEDERYLTAFVQEVRRYYPFFPVVAAKTRHDVDWNGYLLPRGRRVLLDLYGTNHDPRSWTAPEQFSPERFLESEPSRFAFLPQGGGDYHTHHRCPGEPITLALMQQATSFFLHELHYQVDARDLSIRFSRLPALPADELVLREVNSQKQAQPSAAQARAGGCPFSG